MTSNPSEMMPPLQYPIKEYASQKTPLFIRFLCFYISVQEKENSIHPEIFFGMKEIGDGIQVENEYQLWSEAKAFLEKPEETLLVERIETPLDFCVKNESTTFVIRLLDSNWNFTEAHVRMTTKGDYDNRYFRLRSKFGGKYFQRGLGFCALYDPDAADTKDGVNFHVVFNFNYGKTLPIMLDPDITNKGGNG